MPCNGDHMEPRFHEIESNKVMKLMAEVGLYKGDVPFYGKVSSLDEHTALMCKFCKDNDVEDHSLELQIWWRDHQAADKVKLEHQKVEEEKQKALAKISDQDKKLLGI